MSLWSNNFTASSCLNLIDVKSDAHQAHSIIQLLVQDQILNLMFPIEIGQQPSQTTRVQPAL
jgi:hypothetical protein